MELKIYYCKHCHNVVLVLNDGGVAPICCGEKMTLLTANTVEASLEKHIPVVHLENDTLTVQVGSVLHPMVEEHYITFILVETTKKHLIHYLKPNDEPKATFNVKGETVKAVYAACNLHGLWKTEL